MTVEGSWRHKGRHAVTATNEDAAPTIVTDVDSLPRESSTSSEFHAASKRHAPSVSHVAAKAKHHADSHTSSAIVSRSTQATTEQTTSSATPTTPTSDQGSDVTFEGGVDSNGNVASPAFADWTGGYDSSGNPTYDTTKDNASKWFNDAAGSPAATSSAAGTAGGTVTYSFGSGVTAAQQSAFTSALTLWSDEANVTFQQVTSGTVDITFNVTNSGTTSNNSSFYTGDVVGQNHLGSLAPGGAITFNNNGSYGTIGDFSAQGGYGVSATVHEIGHSIGLGHSGPYNDGTTGSDPSTDQFNEYDSRQWSVMSYIDPSQTSKYSSSYTVTGTNTSDTISNGNGTTTYQVAPETPMIDDILAAQRLYGAPAAANTALSGGQTFGFNCNVADAAEPFFDFTKNVNPIITLYDQGSGNTLDCSGFSTNCIINLNPGSFSTADNGTLTNNIGIAYGTKIDTAIGGSGNDTFTVNADNDTINGGGGTNTAVFSGNRSAYTVAPTANGGETVTNVSTQTTDTLTNIQELQFADQTVSTACFASGTRIRVLRDGTRSDVAVEALRVGDLALTASGASRPIRWLGHRSVDCRAHPRPAEVMPIRIAAHAFGHLRPARDLVVSPGHAICLDMLGEVLIPAGVLVNGTTITQIEVARVTYWHVELDGHDILLAENQPAESYLEMGNRGFFAEAAAVTLAASPDARLLAHAGFCRPFHEGGPLVDAVRARLMSLAAARHGSPVDALAGRASIVA